MAGTRHLQDGMTLIELAIAAAIGALVLAALHSVVSLGLRAQAEGGQANELLYQGQFALERMVDAARNTAPKLLTAAAVANTTGNWFAPAGCAGAACVMYCRNTNSQLIETVTTDTACTGTTVIAANVSTFTPALPSTSAVGPLNKPVVILSLTLTHSAAAQPVTLTTSVRLGGGTL